MDSSTFSAPSFLPEFTGTTPSVMTAYYHDVVWVVIVAFIISFFLAMAMGANDVANSFGTSVGSGVISLRQCWLLATVFEILGATLLGSRVSETMRKGILDVRKYNGSEDVLMVGNIAGLAGSAIWQFIATYARLPVSGTHSIVGGILGFTLVQHQMEGVNWKKVGMIIGSWFISPVIAGIVGTACFMFVKRFILVKANPLEQGLFYLPLFYGLTCFCNVISIALSGPPLLGFDKVPIWGKFVLAFGLSAVLALLVRFVLVPYQRNEIVRNLEKKKKTKTSPEEQLNTNQNSSNEASSQVPTVTITPTEKLNIKLIPSGVPGISDEKSGFPRIDTSDSNRPLLSGSAGGSEVSTRNPTPAGSGAVTPQGVPIGTELPSGIDPRLIRTKLFNKVLTSARDSKRIVDTKNTVYQHSSLSTPVDDPVHSIPVDDSKVARTSPTSPTITEVSPAVVLDINEKKTDDTDKEKCSNAAGPTVRDDGPVADKDVYFDDSLADLRKDSPAIAELFKYLQILTACFGGFTHGGNDVSNAVGPLIAIWMIYQEGSVATKSDPPTWLLLYGGLGISFGLIAFGKRVINTMGHDLTPITPSSGFTIEVSSALTVLLASNIGIPISTTHCKVGAIVMVGRYRAKESVSWSLVKKILLAWFVTVPVSGFISAAIFAGLREAL